MNGRILVIEGTATNRIIAKVRLSDAFYAPLMAADGRLGLHLAREEHPDLILVGLPLPDLQLRALMASLRADPATRGIPVLAFTQGSDPAARVAALQAGVNDVLSRPVDDALLFARLRSLLRLRAEAGIMAQAWGAEPGALLGLSEPGQGFEGAPMAAPAITLVSTHCQIAAAWQDGMPHRLRDRLALQSREEVLAGPPGPGGPLPDVFVIEADLDGPGSGLRLMSQLSSHAGTRNSAFCIVTAEGDHATAAMAFDLGADDVVTPGLHAPEMELRLRALLRRKQQADSLRTAMERGLRLAMIDPLTGTYNRRYAMPRLGGIADQAAAEGSTFAVMVVDLDRFKSVNDRFGHAAGDAVLVEVARRLTDNLRLSDLLARIGGEEFLVALPQTSLAEARQVAERLREVISETPVALPCGDALTVTVSIGVAIGCLDAAHGGSSTMMELADKALMSSKTAGRNLVTFSRSAA